MSRPIPTRVLTPVAVACLVVTVLALLGAHDLILVPVAVITVVWAAVMVVRHYTARKEG